MRSLRDTAFALDAPSGTWSLRNAVTTSIWPSLKKPAPTTVSVRTLAKRFGAAGTALRAFSTGNASAWKHLNRATIVGEIRARLRDPAIMRQGPTGFCGPISILMEWARRNPARYVLGAKELFETGKLTCVTGRIIEAEQELRDEKLTISGLAQADWLLAGTLRDDENIWEDVEGDDADDLETLTTWGEQRDWARDVLGLPQGDWETCFVSGEVDVMKMVHQAVSSGGVGYFCIDSALIKNGGEDDEEEAWWQRSVHNAGQPPGALTEKVHSADDEVPWPNHWVAYLGGLSLSADPDDEDQLKFRVWSWGSEFEISCTVEAFSEYLYAGVTGFA